MSETYDAFAACYEIARTHQAEFHPREEGYAVAGAVAHMIARRGKLSLACCMSLNEKAGIPSGTAFDGMEQREPSHVNPGTKVD
jgi:hypothetical protein